MLPSIPTAPNKTPPRKIPSSACLPAATRPAGTGVTRAETGAPRAESADAGAAAARRLPKIVTGVAARYSLPPMARAEILLTLGA
jgi:hypothetical protein